MCHFSSFSSIPLCRHFRNMEGCSRNTYSNQTYSNQNRKVEIHSVDPPQNKFQSTLAGFELVLLDSRVITVLDHIWMKLSVYLFHTKLKIRQNITRGYWLPVLSCQYPQLLSLSKYPFLYL